MANDAPIHPPTRPAVVDDVQLDGIDIHLPVGPDSWHRQGKPQPCRASVKLSYSSAIAAATADDVSLSLDYGKLFRRIEAEIREAGTKARLSGDAHNHNHGLDANQITTRQEVLLGRDVRIIADMIASCGLGLLDETIAGVRRMAHVQPSSPTRRRSSQTSRRMSSGSQAQSHYGLLSPPTKLIDPINTSFGECEVCLHLPKALLRAQEGLKFRSVTSWAYEQADDDAVETGRQTLVLLQEFHIGGISCYCILGVNSHERLEKQQVLISLTFRGSGETTWASKVVETYQEMTRAVAEVCGSGSSIYCFAVYLIFFFLNQRVDSTSYRTVEALATAIARIVTMDFGNESVTVLVQKPSAIAFVEHAGIQITRSKSFFAQQDFWRLKEGLEPALR